MKTNPLVSVIIPIYNTREYLEDCIDSLLNQTLSDIEIILVDDGSTDGSEDICDAFAACYEHIRVIHKKNEGLASARNDGIIASHADYIMFVDSDDRVHPDYCKHPYEAAMRYNADIVLFGYLSEQDGLIEYQRFDYEGNVSRKSAMVILDDYAVGPMAWNKLYKKVLFKNIRYPDGHLHEDEGTTYKLIHNAKAIYCLPEYLYYYKRKRPGSITRRKSRDRLEEQYDMMLQRAKDLIEWGYDYSNRGFQLYMAYLIVIGSEGQHAKEWDDFFQKAVADSTGFTLKNRILLVLYRYSPNCFDLLCRLTGKRA